MSEKEIKSWEVAVAKNQVHQYRLKWTILQAEGFEDLVQECLIYWVQERSKYDPDKGASEKTFMFEVITNYLSYKKRKCSAEKRKAFYEAVSLDEKFDEENNSSSEKSKYEPSTFIDPSIGVDISGVLEKLSPHQKQICSLIQSEGLSFHEISKKINKHHSFVYREADRIRQLFEKQGLRAYLENF